MKLIKDQNQLKQIKFKIQNYKNYKVKMKT